MPSKITLKVVKGALAGKEYEYSERSTCIIGRGLDCNPRLPDDDFHGTISRNHCLLDINPPDARIRDFGSMNGTFVNGRKIGQREQGVSADAVALSEFPEYDLNDGDEITLGGTAFQVMVYTPPACVKCGAEIPEGQYATAMVGENIFLCEEHQVGAGEEAVTRMMGAENLIAESKKCGNCGKDISGEANKARRGEYVCEECRQNPMKIAQALVDEARKGEKGGVENIQGYTIIKELGKGGMGAVYLARHEKTGERVALKVMLPQVATDKASRDMFQREVEVTKALSHPNVVQLLDSGYSGGVFFFTLEYCDGGSVDILMKEKGGKLPVDEALEIALQALDGLEYAHNVEVNVQLANGDFVTSRGIVHRDLKPANIFLSGKGENRIAKIADVGLGKAFDMAGLSGQTRTGAVVGTPYFISRPQVINYKYAKPDIDVWSMAGTLYNMLTGKFPRMFLKGKDPWQIVLQSKPTPIREREPSIPGKLAEVIDAALVDQPEIKVKSARELKKMLLDAVS
ncbi:MAG: serine/threonine-protein kinase [Nitrospinota bacterium]|nr:serine/threonine-protein kinase [Nitrospinota bacterium]